jgi:hypothetical protein
MKRALALAALVLWPAAVQAGPARVWAVGDGEKVEQDDLQSPLRARNAAWDGAKVRLFGARNEVIAFQLQVEADERGIGSLSVSLPGLRQRGGAGRIAYAPPGADPSESAGRPIQVFAVHYMHVTEPSHAEWVWKPGSAPRDTTGWKPVQLVPENARAGRGGLPVRVAASRNQALWIEVYTARDLPAGVYEGVATVTADGQAIPVAVELRLFDFALPDANSLDAMVYYEPSQPELYHGRNLDAAYHRFAHRYRIELVHAYDEAAVRASAGRFDGSDFQRARGYEGPGEGVGNRIVPRSFYGPGQGFDERESAWRLSDAWMSFLARSVPAARTFLYMPDEPSPAEFAHIRTLAANVHSSPGPGKRLPIFVTKHYVSELDGSIDVWCAGPQWYDIARAKSERARGRSYCTYNGGRPQGPAMVIDAPATEARAMAWAAFKHDLDLYFFWHGVHWQHNRQKQGERKQDVWANPITFDNRGQPNKNDHGYINGDGVLLYPGEEKVHPQEDRGIPGPVATVQLANLRRGLQDHQYLTLARQRGLTALVDRVLGAVVPRVFSDAGETVGFAETGDEYEAARLELATALAAAPQGGGPAARPESSVRPRLLLAERDPFSGLPALRARYAAGGRPSDDLPGWALSYLLSGDESFARRAVEEMRGAHLPTRGGSSLYLEYLKWALCFDWLYGWPGFDAALKDRVATELVDGAGRMLALQSLADPAQASYHNHTVRELALAVFALAAVEGHPAVEARAAPLRAQAARALDNILETTALVNPEGGYHESTDYMRITWAPLALLAELRRTTTGDDPARRYGVFRSMGPTYLYKVLPDGSAARDDDNEFPHLDEVDNVVLGYAVHRFKDPFAAWMLQKSGWLPGRWRIPVLEFLWRDETVAPRDPALTTAAELPRERLFPGVGHVVLRDGWGKDATWIAFSCGPYFAKHDHLDTNQFAIYHRGHLALDTGADYTDTESPHYLNYYRRTIAHNTMLVYKPGETFFWGENLWPAANDGGQRMDSSRFWNSVRSLEDWRRTRDLWDRGRVEAFDPVPGRYTYVRGDGTGAYHPSKVERFVRDLLWLPRSRVLFVLDRVRSTDPAFRKAWLLHGVSEPKVEGGGAVRDAGQGGTAHANARLATFEDGEGRLRVHSLLPLDREVTVRGGPGFEFWTPGDDKGGAWGSGQNWPLDPPEGGPLPEDPTLNRMWKTFWGADLARLSPSNRRSVVPGGWRIEVSPRAPARDDVFLSVLEIGDRGTAPLRIDAVTQAKGVAGAVVAGEAAVLLATGAAPLAEGEATLPDTSSARLLLAGLAPGAAYDLQLTSGFAPGAPVWRVQAEANEAGVLETPWNGKNGRLRIRRLPAGRQAEGE